VFTKPANRLPVRTEKDTFGEREISMYVNRRIRKTAEFGERSNRGSPEAVRWLVFTKK